jgi:hypothetical protein
LWEGSAREITQTAPTLYINSVSHGLNVDLKEANSKHLFRRLRLLARIELQGKMETVAPKPGEIV